MKDKRQIHRDLCHAEEHLERALKDNKNGLDMDVRSAYNLIRAAREREEGKRRHNDGMVKR